MLTYTLLRLVRKVKVYVKGPGNGRESAIRAIHACGIEVAEIIEGVFFFDPLNPILPADDQEITCPLELVNEIMMLLKDE